MTAPTVAMVCPYDLETPGGVQGQVRSLAAAFSARGWRVIVAAPGAGDLDLQRCGEFIGLGGVARVRANGSTAPIGLNLFRARSFAHLCETNGVDVVHVHEPLAPISSWPLLARHRLPIVATFHRSGVDALSSVAGAVFGPLMRRIDEPVAVSLSAAQTARDTCGVRADVLFNGVDLPVPGALRPWPKDGPTVLFLGRDEPRKGRAVLLGAATLMSEATTVWVTGESDVEANLRGARVEYLGRISDEEKHRRLLAADVLCAPSLTGESFGVVLLEGLASGARVVASDIDGYRQALGGFGTLVEPNNPQALATALAAAIDQEPWDQGTLGERAALRDYLNTWSMDSLATAYEERYNALIGFKNVKQPD